MRIFSGWFSFPSGHLLLNKGLVPSYIQLIPNTVKCPFSETPFILFGKNWLVQTGFHWFPLISRICFPSKCVFFHHNSNRRWLILWQSCDQCEQSMYSSLEWTNKQSSQRNISAAVAVYIKVSENQQTQEAMFTLAQIIYCLLQSNVAEQYALVEFSHCYIVFCCEQKAGKSMGLTCVISQCAFYSSLMDKHRWKGDVYERRGSGSTKSTTLDLNETVIGWLFIKGQKCNCKLL